jgi:predicted O-methyltransferase YrrM
MLHRIKMIIKDKMKNAADRYTLLTLKHDSNSAVRQIAKSIDCIRQNKEWTNEEKHALLLIQNLRNELENSTESIIVTDYGAGNPMSGKTMEEMEFGTDSTRVIGDICKIAASPSRWGKLMFSIIRNYKPARCLELGTSLGISGSYQLAAMQINKKGELITIEGAGKVAKKAMENFHNLQYTRYSVEVGKFSDVLPNVLSKDLLFDLVFIDGHHDKKATEQYFEQLYPLLSNNSIVIFDDIDWSEGMREIWEQIYTDERITCSFDLNKWGLCVIDKSEISSKKKYYQLSL